MADREAYEAWFATADVRFCWEAWQAAIKLEREACALICDDLGVDRDAAPADCATAIRARGE